VGNIFQHSDNFEVNIVIKPKSLVQRRLVAKIFFCCPFRDERGVGLVQYVFTLSRDNWEIENLKKFPFRKRQTFFEFIYVAIFFNCDQLLGEATNPGDFCAIGIVIAKSQSKGGRHAADVANLIAVLLSNKPIYSIRVLVEIIEGKVIVNDRKYQYCAGYSQR
jgi:hypothetical protein